MNPTLEQVYETIVQWDECGGKRSRRELARRIVALYSEQPVFHLRSYGDVNEEDLKTSVQRDPYPGSTDEYEAWVHDGRPEPQQEPVAWIHGDEYGDACHWVGGRMPTVGTKLYTAAPRREWQGLTDEQIDSLYAGLFYGTIKELARALDALLKERNT